MPWANGWRYWASMDSAKAKAVDHGSRRRRFRPRFSLRALLLFMTLSSVWLGLSLASARRQERAVKAIEAAGGSVSYAHDFDFATGRWIEGAPPGPVWLRSLLGRHYFDTVIDVSFHQHAMKQADKRLADAAPYLAHLPRLRKLLLWGLELEDDEFAAVVNSANPEELSCVMMTVSDGAAAQLTSAARLRELGLNDVIISAHGASKFKNLPNLERFSLCCRHMERSPSGEIIWGSEKYGLRDDALHAFLEFPRLRHLSLSWTQITDDGVAILSRLEQLESLAISSPHISDAAMDDVVKFKNIEWLSLGGTQIGDASVSRLRELGKLKGLRLSAAVTNQGLPLVAQLERLETLSLGGKRVDDSGLLHLAGMKNLRKLDLQTTAVTTNGPAVKELKRALPNCSIRQYYPSPSFR